MIRVQMDTKMEYQISIEFLTFPVLCSDITHLLILFVQTFVQITLTLYKTL